jgi:antitoxin (DNA-binding transcriptional repressor) of toxin-antitoxin stability system
MSDLYKRIVSITELRRNFGELTANLGKIDSLILTKGGEPFATLKAVPEEKMKVLKKAAGAWKGTKLDSNKIWREVVRKKSRKRAVIL